ncbi:MAG: SH3 domain-containing protein, partial [Planctomycetota bacterium]
MFLNRLVARVGLWTVGVAVLVVSATAAAQTAEPRPVTGEGEITANDVYVRSGDSLNHYTISKLKAGDRVSVVSERGEWYEILPPEGTFSLVSGDFIDTTDNQSGVINGDNVRVRAGSLLNENKYTVQTLLAKGTQVSILGRNPDGFVRIKPPTGATLWVNRSYVQLRTGGTTPPVREGVSASPSQADAAGEVAPAVTASAAESAKKLAAPMTGPASTTWRRQLEEIDVAARAELAKPMLDRNFNPFVARYQPIADQTEDDFAHQYAVARIDQVKNMGDFTSAVERVRKLDDVAETKQREFLAARGMIPEFVPTRSPTGIEIQGELRVSALYPAGSSVQRYRLIDPTSESDRTIGYVEITPDSGLNVEGFLGRYVGVRASAQRVQTGGVNPVPIYIARELVLLEPPQTAGKT